MKKNISLKSALLIIFILLAIVPMIIIGIIAQSILANTLKEDIQKENSIIANAVKDQTKVFIKYNKNILTLIKNALNRDRNVNLSLLTNNFENIETIQLLTQEGKVSKISSEDKTAIGIDYSEKPFFKEAIKKGKKDKIYFSPSFLSVDGKPTITSSIAYKNGVILTYFDLQELTNNIANLSHQKTKYIGIVDSTGTYIAHSDISKVFERINIHEMDFIDTVSNSLNPAENFVIEDFDGERVLLNTALIKESNWIVIVYQPTEFAYSPIIHLKIAFGTSMLITVLVSSILGYFLSNRISKPILSLVEITKSISKGNYDINFQMKNYSEFNHLIENFNTMAEAVYNREKEIKESEKRIKKFFEVLPLAVHIVDKDGNPVLINKRGKDIFRIKKLESNIDEILDKVNFYYNNSEEKIPVDKLPLIKALQGKYVYTDNFEIEINGDRIPLEVWSAPIYDNENNIEFAMGIFADITLKKLTEKRIRESEEKYRILVETASDSIFALNADGIFVSANKEAARQIGITKEGLINNSLFQIFPKEVAEGNLYAIKQIYETGKPILGRETKVPTVDGEKWFNTSLVPVKNAEGKILYVVAISRDISEKKKMEANLKNMMSKLKESNKELEQFAYIASHDLQSPVRTIINYLQMLEKKYLQNLDETGLFYIQRAIMSGKRMNTMVNDLLSYSRVTIKAKEYVLCDLNKILQDVIDNLEYLIVETGAEITYDNLPSVYCDNMQIGRLFQNLISNGIKYRKEGVKPQIKISVFKKSAKYIFSVSDNGIGIENEFYKKIFMIFQRLHTKEEYSGNGIGLAICKKIVERHGGKIWVDSVYGEGTAFYFSLPTSLAD